MHYHIGNMLILQEFNGTPGCPLCRIRNILETRAVEQYLNEAVMEDDRRHDVNERGFCAHHTQMMLARQNKLSLALQYVTRLTTLKGRLEITADKKIAKKMAERFEHSGKTCVICDGVRENMERYYKTIAEMFAGDPNFATVFASTGGFCMEHFGALLRNSAYAHSREKSYLYELTKLQKTAMAKLLEDLQWFCAKHDYRNADKPWNGADTALARADALAHGTPAK